MSWVAAANVRFPLWPGAGDFLPLHSISRWGRGHSVGIPGPFQAQNERSVPRYVRFGPVHPRMTAFNASPVPRYLTLPNPALSSSGPSFGCIALLCPALPCLQELEWHGYLGRHQLPYVRTTNYTGPPVTCSKAIILILQHVYH